MLAAMARNIAIVAGQHIEASAPGRQVAARNGPPHPASPEQETLLFTTEGAPIISRRLQPSIRFADKMKNLCRVHQRGLRGWQRQQ